MTENKFTYVLFTQNRDNNTIGAYKFGFSRNIKGVFNRCKNGNTWLTHLEVVCYCDFNIITEKQLKEKYKNSRKTKEWFSLSKSNLQEIHLLMSLLQVKQRGVKTHGHTARKRNGRFFQIFFCKIILKVASHYQLNLDARN